MAEVIYDCHLASHLPYIHVEHPFDGAPATINQPTDGHVVGGGGTDVRRLTLDVAERTSKQAC
jgi:hypothetical protein